MFDTIIELVNEVIADSDSYEQEYIEALQSELNTLESLERQDNEVNEKRLEFLNCLEAAGVDNWSGYDDAMEMLEEED